MTTYDAYDELAWLYDIAFDWDVEAEVEWLLERFDMPVHTLLEPACGSGRMFQPFFERGVEIVGIDVSPAMVERAVERMHALNLPTPRVYARDMTDFDLGETFDGALCPINSFGYLLTEDAVRSHLRSVARHLQLGGKYLVQVDLLDTSVSVDYAKEDSTTWEAHDGTTTVRCTWSALSFDAGTSLQTESCRFEVVTGPSAGNVYEELHRQRKWSWAEWIGLLASSPFELAAVYDAGEPDSIAPLPLDDRVEDAHLTWHELVMVGAKRISRFKTRRR